ncbi:MAG: hypothetical protein IPP88_18155 [Betaproteobacteria bacterium]|nr:hypothetical protein [Betaproteobacteria bacterium]
MLILGFPIKDFLGLTVLGALVTTFGTLFGLFLKEHLFARSFESWKQRKLLEQVYKRYRDPLNKAAYELAIRFKEICESDGLLYMRREILLLEPATLSRAWPSDPHYQQHKLRSTVYRLCSFLGWLELYRQEIVFLGGARTQRTERFEAAVDAIREVFADGGLNGAEDWSAWHDLMLFREELRAIGEAMLVERGGIRTVIGYKVFWRLEIKKIQKTRRTSGYRKRAISSWISAQQPRRISASYE